MENGSVWSGPVPVAWGHVLKSMGRSNIPRQYYSSWFNIFPHVYCICEAVVNNPVCFEDDLWSLDSNYKRQEYLSSVKKKKKPHTWIISKWFFLFDWRASERSFYNSLTYVNTIEPKVVNTYYSVGSTQFHRMSLYAVTLLYNFLSLELRGTKLFLHGYTSVHKVISLKN